MDLCDYSFARTIAMENDYLFDCAEMGSISEVDTPPSDRKFQAPIPKEINKNTQISMTESNHEESNLPPNVRKLHCLQPHMELGFNESDIYFQLKQIEVINNLCLILSNLLL